MADRIETISERILKLLKLENEFEMSYEEYIRHLREALVAASLTKSIYSSEEAELLREEFKRVRGKTGRFTINAKKVKVTDKNVPPSKKGAVKFLTGKVEPKKEELQDKKAVKKTNLFDIVLKISESVNNIYKSLIEQNKILSKVNEDERKRRENLGRSAREESLEKGPNKLIEAAKKILTPFQSIWDRIFKFLLFTILGRAFKTFLDWAKNPDNKKRLEVLGRLLKDFWPAILAAWFLFATPLGKFIRTITGTIIKLSLRLTKFAIPKLLTFIKKNPLVAAGAATGLAAFGAEMWRQKEETSLIGKEAEKRDIKPEQVKKEVTDEKSSPVGLFGQAMQSIGPLGYRDGGVIPTDFIDQFKGGGTFSGVVTNNDGTYTRGYGQDTQYFPIAGTNTGAVLQPGEIVMNQQQQRKMYRDTGRHPAEYVPGPKSGKVKKYNTGGMIGNSPNFWSLAAIAAREAGSIPQGQADVAQSIYNRAKVGIYPGGRDVKGIITAANQYAPTFGNLGAWLSIKDRQSAAAAVGKDYVKRLDMAAKSLMNPSLQQNAAKFVGSRTDFRGESQKPHMDPGKGDITRGNGHNFFGWMSDNAYKSKLKTPAPIPSFIPKSTVGKPEGSSKESKPKEKKKTSGFMNWIKSALPFKGGTTEKYGPIGKDGRVLENSGRNIPGTDDRQQLNMKVQPGEYLRVFTEGFARKGGMAIIDYLQAALDSDSNARKEGVLSNSKLNRYIPPAPSYSNGGIQIIPLPPTIKNSTGPSGTFKSASGSGVIPEISAVPASGIFVRKSNAEIYGIIG